MTRFSVEVFPPRGPEGLAPLGDAVTRLNALEPLFVSVTYGAGGSNRERSFDAIASVGATGATIAGHLTCVGQPCHEIDAVLDRYASLGVRQVVALRGDPPDGVGAPYAPHPDGYRRTSDLVAAVARRQHFDIAVSAYPEAHPQSPSLAHDLDVLADKVAAGATTAITQMFFDNQLFLRYRDAVAARGIDVRLVPGIFPIHSFPAVARFAERCGASMPAWIAARFDGLDDDPVASQRVAAELAAEQIAELAAEGTDQVHLYTLNRADLALAVHQLLLEPAR
jgi:methylenetetrahydrofolate reductase (NADPH)